MSPDDQQPGTPQPGPAGPPVCYRHPDRVSHIRCTRCERPVCGDCMVSASVGFQCPDCVHQGTRQVREARTVAGGRVEPSSGLVTKVLIGLNIAVFVLVLATGDGPLGNKVVGRLELLGLAFVPSLGEVGGIADGEWYRLVTAAFLHQQFWHIGLNMVGLWMLGPALEAALGRIRFIALYLVSALGGSALSYLIAAQNQPSLGASGAIFGLFGAMIVLGRRLKYDLRPLIVLLVLNLMITFLNTDSIDWRAHLGGLAAGTLAAIGLVYAPRRNRTLIQVGSLLAVLAVIVAIVAIRTAQLT
ncbi:rhomboid family intramembrane serine protease [Streptomyces sp. SID3343]|uniref:rhomboid family intramembrane serine protease n=1 Tax=Streptomyces sp. SID3343 TaxID=2690260 RepID=UPI0013693168|nr:rhomboid family intramembrane serine protease [Streptomyces sp. SID3343]MYW01818.1 rhomboid family intramembrane serine protease [Streptomyces sp. SID3343]